MARLTGRIFQALLFCAVTLAGTASAEDKSELVEMFEWWNSAMAAPGGFTEKGFSRHFTDDAAIVINGEERVRGVRAMVDYFQGIQQHSDYVRIEVPFREEFRCGDRIFTEHYIDAKRDGRLIRSHAMGYAALENGKIDLISLVRYDESVEKTAQ